MNIRLVASFLLAVSVPGLGSLSAMAQSVAVASPQLSDGDVRKMLTRDESSKWDSLLSARKKAAMELASATRQLESGAVNSAAVMKGFDNETPEQRRAKAEKRVEVANASLVTVDKGISALRDLAVARLEKSTLRIEVPYRDLRTEYAVVAAKFAAAAKAAGFTHVALAGVYSPVGEELHVDAGLSDSLRAAFTSSTGGLVLSKAPVFKGGALVVSPVGKTGVVVAEIFPAKAQGGLCSIVRLVDPKTFKVLASSIAMIPSKTGVTQPALTLTLLDKQNFFFRLGDASRYSFGVEGRSLDAALLRAIFAGHSELVTNDYEFLASVLGGSSPDTVSTAFWIARPGSDDTGFNVETRAAARSTSAPVGEVTWGVLAGAKP